MTRITLGAGVLNSNSGRKLFICCVVAGLIASLVASPAIGARARVARELPSPPGQVVIASVNARQHKVLGIHSFSRLHSLIVAMRNRPRAFDAGAGNAISAPDVLVVQEMTYSNLEIFQNILNQTSQFDYQIAHAEGAVPKLLYNAKTVDLVGLPVPWVDPCKTGTDGKQTRIYQYARFIEKSSSLPFTVASVHFSNRYTNSEGMQCRVVNTAELIRQLAAEQGAVFAGGDFNFPAVKGDFECDPDERSEPTDWWSLMTTPAEEAPSFIDSVREWHRRQHTSMASAWTFERFAPAITCRGTKAREKFRIDYMFARNAIVAEAHADDPTWAGAAPLGRTYSDHRLVWGRYVLGGPPRPSAPVSTPRSAGVIDITWEPVEGATGYVIYRKRPGEAYTRLDTVDATATAYSDPRTVHRSVYRYSVAAVGASGAQGFESKPVAEVADARGPQVVSHSPYSGASRVPRSATVYVRHDENVAADSVTPTTILLVLKPKWKNGHDRLIGGAVRHSGQLLIFDPHRLLERRRTYVVKVRTVRDELGNPGRWSSFSFRT